MNSVYRRSLLAILLVTLILLSGCTLPGTEGHHSNVTPTSSPNDELQTTPATHSPTSTDTQERTGFTDPRNDTLGWEEGYWHDEPVNVTQGDGLSDGELDTLVARSMARVEYLREAEFDSPVNVTVKSREEHRKSNPYSSNPNSTHNEWNNQVWEALFITGESDDIGTEIEEVTGGSVLGYYSPNSGELVIVTDSPDQPTVSNTTLIHELTHALQDQRFNLSRTKYNPSTQDSQLANNGLVEGEAKYIEQRYVERCDSGEWKCVATPSSSSGTASSGNIGIQMVMFQPYSDGPAYIRHLLQTGGWDAVDQAFIVPPIQSRQIIHPGMSYDEIRFPILDDPRNNWTRFDNVGDSGADSVGEASVFMMMWYQNYKHSIETIPRSSIQSDGSSRFSYEHEVSHGLVDDRITPYKNGDKRGYIWQLRWNSSSDAKEFKQAYERILRGHGGKEVSPSVWVIQEGKFKDAYSIRKHGANITIVNAPTRDSLSNLAPKSHENVDNERSLPNMPIQVISTVLGVGGLLLLALWTK